MDVQITVRTKEVQKVLSGVNFRMRSYRKIFEEYRSYLEATYALNFATGGSLVGGWPPETSYGSWDVRQGLPSLFRTGALMESLTNLHGVPNDIKAKQATFGTNIKYAKFHQHGTSEMPSRPVVFIPDGSSLFFAERIAQHLDPSPALSPLKAMIYR